MSNHYKRSKWQAEQVATRFVRDGLPVIIVNPSTPVGPRDVKPTPTGQVIVDFLNRRMPAYLDTGLNWVHVRDVAIGHILAAQKGCIGERYILGNAEGNWTMKQMLCRPGRSHRHSRADDCGFPIRLALGAAYANEAISSFTRQPPRAPLAGVRMARHMMYFNPAKAIRELGLPQTSPKQALADAGAMVSPERIREMRSIAVFEWPLQLRLLCAWGCGGLPAEPAPAEVYQRATNEFAAAEFFKPAEPKTNDLTISLAPLILQEVKGEMGRQSDFDRFGTLSLSNDVLVLDRSRPAIYWQADSVQINGRAHTRFSYYGVMRRGWLAGTLARRFALARRPRHAQFRRRARNLGSAG